MKNDRLYLVHIIECIEKIERFTTEGKDSFLLDDKTQDAVLRNLHTLAFRNVVVHDYLGLELTQIWDIIVVDLPPVKHSVLTMLQEF
jgi:uncharacterized protein with HEPN domain